jgi:ABC-type transporter Mla subunit MlaD
MAARLYWSDLRTGLIAVGVIAGIVISILLFARVGALHGKTYKVYVTADDVSGVLAGTEVWLAGKKIGLVHDVHFRPVTADTLQRVVIETDILDEAMPYLRRNSRAEIRPAGTMIGTPVVYIKPGTLSSPPVREGDTIRYRGPGRFATVGMQVDTLADRLVALAQTSGALVDKMSDPSNSVGAFRSRGVEQLRSVSAVASSYTTRATRGSGSLGLAYQNAVQARIKRVMAARDSITLFLNSGSGNFGRFRRDSTLTREVAGVRAGFDSLRLLTSGAGPLTRLRTDTALKTEIARARAQLDSLMKEIKKHPLRYISF